MADLNKVFLMGRLTFDPELRRTPSGTAVTELRMATNRSWAGRDGERREETLFIDVTVWDRQAETCCQYLRKGSSLHVEGYLRWIAGTTRRPAKNGRRSAFKPIAFSSSTRAAAMAAASPARRVTRSWAAPPAAVREPAPRRAPATGPGEPRGQSNGSGPARPPYPSTTTPRSRPAAEPEEQDEEDIPF